MSTLILFFHSMKLMCTKFGDQWFNNEDVSLERPKKWGSDLLRVGLNSLGQIELFVILGSK